jgi:hypothetical protein
LLKLKFTLPKHEKLIKDRTKQWTFRRDLNNIFRIGQTVELWKYKNYYSNENSYKFGDATIIDVNQIEINLEEQKVYLGDICIKHRIALDTEELQVLLETDGFPNEEKFWEYYEKHKYIKTLEDEKLSLKVDYNYKMINFRLME